MTGSLDGSPSSQDPSRTTDAPAVPSGSPRAPVPGPVTSGQATDDVLVLAPSVARAAGWTVVGAVAIGCAGFVAGRSTGVVSVFAASLMLASVAFTLPFALQTFAPSAWTLRYRACRLWGFAAAMPVDVELTGEGVEVRIRRLLGDRALRVVDGSRRRWVLLPVGADASGLQRAIEADVAPSDPGPARSTSE